MALRQLVRLQHQTPTQQRALNVIYRQTAILPSVQTESVQATPLCALSHTPSPSVYLDPDAAILPDLMEDEKELLLQWQAQHHTLDLTDGHVQCEDLCVLCGVMKTRQDVATINLSHNGLASLVEFRALVGLLEANIYIVEVNVGETNMPEPWRLAIAGKLARNNRQLAKKLQASHCRNTLTSANTWREVRLEARHSLLVLESQCRASIAEEYHSLRASMTKTYEKEHQKLLAIYLKRERRRRNHAQLSHLCSDEAQARCTIEVSYFKLAMALLEAQVISFASYVTKEWAALRVHSRQLYLENWRLAKANEKRRTSQEEAERASLCSLYEQGADDIAAAREASLATHYTSFVAIRSWIAARDAEVRALQDMEEELRDTCYCEALEGLKFIYDRRRLVEQQREIQLLQERRALFTEEEDHRKTLSGHEQQVLPLLRKCFVPYLRYVDARCEYLQITKRRNDYMLQPPILKVSPGTRKRERFTLYDNAWVSVCPSAQVSMRLPDAWEREYEEVHASAKLVSASLRELVSHFSQIASRQREILAQVQYTEATVQMLNEIEAAALKFTVRGDDTHTNADCVEFPSAEDVAVRKQRIWGGAINVTFFKEAGVNETEAEEERLKVSFRFAGEDTAYGEVDDVLTQCDLTFPRGTPPEEKNGSLRVPIPLDDDGICTTDTLVGLLKNLEFQIEVAPRSKFATVASDLTRSSQPEAETSAVPPLRRLNSAVGLALHATRALEAGVSAAKRDSNEPEKEEGEEPEDDPKPIQTPTPATPVVKEVKEVKEIKEVTPVETAAPSPRSKRPSDTSVKPFSIRVQLSLEVLASSSGVADRYMHKLRSTPTPLQHAPIRKETTFHTLAVLPFMRVLNPICGRWKEGSESASRGMRIVNSIKVTEPPIISENDDGTLTVVDGTGLKLTHFGGATIEVRFIEGYTDQDHVFFKSTAAVQYTEIDKTIRIKEVPVATLVTGTMLAKVVAKGETHGMNIKPSGGTLVLNLANTTIFADVVALLLDRLRFCNITDDPVEGDRVVQVTLHDVEGSRSVIKFRFVVEAVDDPAQLTLTRSSLFFRTDCGNLPDELKSYSSSRHLPLAICKDCLLEDPDTVNFAGGYVDVVGSQFQRNDTMYFDPSVFDPHSSNPLKVSRFHPYQVSYEGTIIGTLLFTVNNEINMSRAEAKEKEKERERDRSEKEKDPNMARDAANSKMMMLVERMRVEEEKAVAKSGDVSAPTSPRKKEKGLRRNVSVTLGNSSSPISSPSARRPSRQSPRVNDDTPYNQNFNCSPTNKLMASTKLNKADSTRRMISMKNGKNPQSCGSDDNDKETESNTTITLNRHRSFGQRKKRALTIDPPLGDPCSLSPPPIFETTTSSVICTPSRDVSPKTNTNRVRIGEATISTFEAEVEPQGDFGEFQREMTIDIPDAKERPSGLHLFPEGEGKQVEVTEDSVGNVKIDFTELDYTLGKQSKVEEEQGDAVTIDFGGKEKPESSGVAGVVAPIPNNRPQYRHEISQQSMSEVLRGDTEKAKLGDKRQPTSPRGLSSAHRASVRLKGQISPKISRKKYNIEEPTLSGLGVVCYKEISLMFVKDGSATIEATRQFIRSLIFYNSSTSGQTNVTRTISITLRLGPTIKDRTDIPEAIELERCQEAVTNLSIKATPPLFTVKDKFFTMRYTRGAGPQRLSAFDVLQDSLLDVFDGGSLFLEFAEGFVIREDAFGLRDGDGLILTHKEWVVSERTYLLQEETERVLGGSTGNGANQPRHLNEVCQDSIGALQSRKLPSSKALDTSLKGKPKKPTEPTQPTTPLSFASTSLSELTLDGRPIGQVYVDQSAGTIHIRFMKNCCVKKREILLILKSLTYTNSKAVPTAKTRKVARLLLTDSGYSSSQSFVEIALTHKDYVSEIHLSEKSVKYRPCMEDLQLPLTIAPLHRSCILDEDTELFTAGGSLMIEMLAGGAKGDNLFLMTPEQQSAHLALPLPNPRPAYVHPDPEACQYVINESAKSITVVESGAVLTYVYPKNSLGTNDVRIAFPTKAPFVSLLELSYILSCVAFNNFSERLREGTRFLHIRLTDGGNPVEAKEKLNVDVKLPVITYPGGVMSVHKTLVVGVNTPFAKGGCSLSEGPGTGTVPSSLLVVTMSPAPTDDMTSLSVVFVKESGFRVEGGSILCGPHVVGQLVVMEATIKLTVNMAARERRAYVTHFMKSIQVKLSAPLLEARTVQLHFYEDGKSRCGGLCMTT